MKKEMFGILALLMLVCCTFASAAFTATISTPAASATIRGVVQINVTTTNTNVTNCTVYASSPSTANSSAVALFVVTNESSASATLFNKSWNSSTVLEDASDYSMYAICKNSTGSSATSATLTGLIIDNTKPTAFSIGNEANAKLENGGVITATVTDATTTGCTLYLGSNEYAMDYATTKCTYTVTRAIPDRVYSAYIIASDGLNTTTSAAKDLRIAVRDNSGITPAVAASAVKSAVDAGNKSSLVMIVLLLGLLYYLVSQKKRN